MAAFVFTDKSLEPNAGRFVWLKIDIENSKNSAFLTKYKIEAVPSLYVFNPKSETVAIRYVGAATVPQLKKLLADGERAVAGRGGRLAQALGRADKLYGAGRNAEAAKAYQETLKLAPAGWPRYGRTVESLLFALSSTNESETCANIAKQTYPKLRKTSSSANVAAMGLDCAVSLPSTNHFRSELVAQLRQYALEVVASNVTMAADDRSGVYGSLVSEREEAGDEPGTKDVAGKWAAFLEKEAAAAKSPEARTVFDSHRLSAYLAVDQPERAIPMLQQSERDLPDDYNPPARLAIAYLAMKKYDEALAASDRALPKVYGPRKLGVLRTRADIYKGKGDIDAAKKTIEDAIAFAESLPEGQRSERSIAALKKRLDTM